MGDNNIKFDFGRKPPPIDPVVVDSLELLRIFHRAADPAQRRAIIRMLDYMLPDHDPSMSDGVYPP